MSEGITNRLDKIENEIRLLLMLQKRPESRSTCRNSQESKKSQKRRPKSAVDICRKLTISQQKKRRAIEERRSASSTGISRLSSTSPSPSTSPRRERSHSRCSKKNRSSSRASEKSSTRNAYKCKGSPKQHNSLTFCNQDKASEKSSTNKCSKSIPKQYNPSTCCNQNNPINKTSELKVGFQLEKRNILEDEVNNLKELVEELNSSRATALSVCQQWRDKYNHLKSHKCAQAQSWQCYKTEKAQLISSLEQERIKLRAAMEHLEDSDKQLSCYKKVCQKYDDLVKMTNDKAVFFAKINSDNRELATRCEELAHELDLMNGKYTQLQNTNQAFAKDVLNRCKTFEGATTKADKNAQRIKTENQKLQSALKELTDLKNASDKNAKKECESNKALGQEIERLQAEINRLKESDVNRSKEMCLLTKKLAEACKDKESNLKKLEEVSQINKKLLEDSKARESNAEQIAQLKQKVAELSKYKEAEGKRCEEIEQMKKKICELKEVPQKRSCSCAKKFDAEKAKLKEKCSNIQKESAEKERCANERCTNLQCQLELTRTSLRDIEDRLESENGELRALAEELTSIILNQKNRIEDMINLTNKHKEMFDNQTRALDCKNQELSASEEELVNLRKRYEDLERHLNTLSSTMENDLKAKRCNMEHEVNNLKQLLEDETHKLRVKEKIVDDQVNSISQLKKKLAEKDDTVAKLYKEMNFHKKEKNDLNCKMLQLSEEKNAMMHDLNRQHTIIENLEKKIVLQHREWELQTELQVREKEKALCAAQFATEKLIETMHDFQKQTESQNQVRNALASLLQEKDDKLRAAILQISSLTFDPDMVMRVAEKCDQARASKTNNEATDSNDSFASCRASLIPETHSSARCSDPGRSRPFVPEACWYQINPPLGDDYDEQIEKPSKTRCDCVSECGPFDISGVHLQYSSSNSPMSKVRCGCKPVCRCDSPARNQPAYSEE